MICDPMAQGRRCGGMLWKVFDARKVLYRSRFVVVRATSGYEGVYSEREETVSNLGSTLMLLCSEGKIQKGNP